MWGRGALLCCAACGILVTQPEEGIKPVPTALEAQNLTHGCAREVPLNVFFYSSHSPCSFIQVVLSKCLTAFAINSALQGIKFLLLNLLTNKAKTTINHIDSRTRRNGWNPLNFSQGWRSVLVSTRWRSALWYSNYASMPKVEKLFVLFLFSALWISVFVSLSKWISLINHIVSIKTFAFW